MSSATRREGSRSPGLPFCPLYLYGFSCPQLRSSRGKGIRNRSASEILPWSLRCLGPPSSDYAVGGGVQSASHTCCVYRLPSESIASTFSSIVGKHTGPVKVEVRKSSRVGSSRGSNSNEGSNQVCRPKTDQHSNVRSSQQGPKQERSQHDHSRNTNMSSVGVKVVVAGASCKTSEGTSDVMGRYA